LRGKGLVRQHGKLILIPKVPGKASIKFPIKDETSGWTLNSLRCGAIGKKAGMTMEWDNFGILRPLTLIKIDPCIVTKILTKEEHGLNAIQVGADEAKVKHLNRAQLGYFASLGVPPMRHLQEFKVTPNAFMPLGTEINCEHFVVGQRVSVTGTSKGKGFAGVMKRWGFSGGAASHGNSLAHRIPGSTGARQNPGKVWKGKKMAGRMGGETTQVVNLTVFEIYPQLNTIAVIGCVPGPNGGYLRIVDSSSNKFSEPPPFPTKNRSGDDNTELIQFQFKNPWHQIPDLTDHYWRSNPIEYPERLFNGHWVPQFSTILSDQVKRFIKDKTADREKAAARARTDARLRGEGKRKK